MRLLALYAVVLPCVAGAVAYLLRRFPTPGTSPVALAAAGISFAAALSVTLLVPLDVYWLYNPGVGHSHEGGSSGAGGVVANAEASKDASSARAQLSVAWNAAYWSTVVATVLLPLLQVRGTICVSVVVQRSCCAVRRDALPVPWRELRHANLENF
jgi:uncharacterized membrane protein (UPF0182 family)